MIISAIIIAIGGCTCASNRSSVSRRPGHSSSAVLPPGYSVRTSHCRKFRQLNYRQCPCCSRPAHRRRNLRADDGGGEGDGGAPAACVQPGWGARLRAAGVRLVRTVRVYPFHSQSSYVCVQCLMFSMFQCYINV